MMTYIDVIRYSWFMPARIGDRVMRRRSERVAPRGAHGVGTRHLPRPKQRLYGLGDYGCQSELAHRQLGVAALKAAILPARLQLSFWTVPSPPSWVRK